MKVIFRTSFRKKLKKLKKGDKNKFYERLRVFIINSFDPVLNNHALRGKYKRYRSINITGDLRAIFEIINDNIAYFVTIDTHPNLYK